MNTDQESVVPQELVDLTISFLWNEPKTLAVASLVSSSWAPTCQRVLFSRILLHYCDCGGERSDALYEALLLNPSLATLIRQLTVYEGIIPCPKLGKKPCFALSPSFPKLLKLIHHLQYFEFRGFGLTNWNEYYAEVQDAVVSVVSSLDLTHLILDSWNMVPSPTALSTILNASGKQLKNLELIDIATPLIRTDFASLFHPDARPEAPVPISKRRRLDSLLITDGTNCLVPFFSRWFSLHSHSLSTLYLTCSKNSGSISTLLKALGENLECLNFEVAITSHDDRPPNLEYNTNLRTLHLQITEYSFAATQVNMSLPYIINMLSSLRSYGHLEEVFMHFDIDTDRLRQAGEEDGVFWDQLDSILYPRNYKFLHRVQIGIRFNCMKGVEYIQEAQEHAGNLHRATILSLYSDISIDCSIGRCSNSALVWTT